MNEAAVLQTTPHDQASSRVGKMQSSTVDRRVPLDAITGRCGWKRLIQAEAMSRSTCSPSLSSSAMTKGAFLSIVVQRAVFLLVC